MRAEPALVNDGTGVRIEPCTLQNLDEWSALRHALWPEGSEQEHRAEAQAMLWEQKQAVALLARLDDGTVAAFAEAALRHDYVNGCSTSPVGFLEDIYVKPEHRHRGLARLLCRAAEDWARRQGCREFASDVLIHNTGSQDMHRALGFEETDRVVYYRKPLAS